MPTASILTGSWGFLALVFGGLTLYWLLALMMDAIRSSTRTALLLAAAIAGCIAAAGDYFLRAGTLDLPGRLALLLSWILTWKVVTRAQPEGTLFGADWRIAALVLAVGASFLPGLWIPWLAVCLGPLHGWTHHTSLPFRFVGLHAAVHCAELVLMTLGMAVFDWTAVRWALSLSLYASHFVVPAISKVQLGVRAAEHSREDAPTERPHVPKAGPTSAGGRAAHGLEWVIVNRTSCIIANAWVWGWRMPGLKMARLLWSVGRRHERLINTVVLLIEFAPLLGILWPAFLPVSLFLALVFLVLVFVGTGICFWEYAVLTTGLGLLVVLHPSSALPLSLRLVAALFALTAWYGAPFKANRLAWWDCPIAQPVVWLAHTSKGALHLPNSFFISQEREFGRTLGYCASTEPIVSDHLGIVHTRQARDALYAWEGDAAGLAKIDQHYARDWHDAKQTQWLTEWLQAFFSSRRGARPHGVTRILRLLRAPGEQWFDGDAAPSLDEETEVWAVEAVLKTYFTEEGPGKAELIASRSLLYVPLEGGA